MKTYRSFWYDMIEKLKNELNCLAMRHIVDSDDPDEYVWHIKGMPILFQVEYVGDAALVSIIDDGNTIDSEKTEDPKKAIQKAKDFKSKYFKYLE